MSHFTNFTHLHVHSHYSLLGATPSSADLVARAVANGLDALALTDTNTLSAAIAFARICRAAAIKPITGMVVSISLPAGLMPPDTISQTGTLVLLARNANGYRSLCRLSSLILADPDHRNRRLHGLSWDDLAANRDGLFCLTGGRAGWLERLLRNGQTKAASRYVAQLGGLFGEQCGLGISHALVQPEASALVDQVLSLGRRFGIRAAAVQPIYTLGPDERPQLKLLAAINHNCPLAEVASGHLPDLGDEATPLHGVDSREMAVTYAQFPELIAAAGEIAAGCREDVLPDGKLIWPSMSFVDGNTADQRLRQDAEQGLVAFYSPGAASTVVHERLERELRAIIEYGYAPLFLLIADVVRFARRNDIPVSTRGSVANSLVAYCLGISTVDPVAHDLLFERFISPARRSPPDIDLDFCSRRRDEVLAYIRNTYGLDRVAMISTMNTFQPRSAVRETGKAYSMNNAEIAKLVGVLPRGWHPDPRRRNQETIADVLAKLDDAKERQVIREAYTLVGRPHHPGLHPGGVVITPGPLTDYVPILISPKGFYATQYEHSDVEAVGLPKLDLLGIRALTVLADAAVLVRTHHDPQFRLQDIPTANRVTGDLLAAGETIGVFQCESEGARRTLRQLRAREIGDLAIAGAFFKPGPATGGMARAFVRRYRGEEPVQYLHPTLEPILSRTKGVLLFQEQVLRLATEIAGLGWEQADRLRRGMSKFQANEMEAIAAEFQAGCCRPVPDGPGFSVEQAARLWEQVVAFAGYGFNQGHATAYADVSYRSAYVKAHWPAEFLAARLADAGGFHHPAIYMAEARRLGISVRPPHINYSRRGFTLTYEPDANDHLRAVLWMGLGQVRDLHQTTIQAIIARRAKTPFVNVADLLAAVAGRPKEIMNLIRCGGLDGLGKSRRVMLDEAGLIDQSGSPDQMAFDFINPVDTEAETPGERYRWENRLLGLPISIDPLSLINRPTDVVALRELPQTSGRLVTIVAYRLPGWSGGPSILVSDGDDFIYLRLDKMAENKHGRLQNWQPYRLRGRWVWDEWHNGWFQATAIETMPTIERERM